MAHKGLLIKYYLFCYIKQQNQAICKIIYLSTWCCQMTGSVQTYETSLRFIRASQSLFLLQQCGLLPHITFNTHLLRSSHTGTLGLGRLVLIVCKSFWNRSRCNVIIFNHFLYLYLSIKFIERKKWIEKKRLYGWLI